MLWVLTEACGMFQPYFIHNRLFKFKTPYLIHEPLFARRRWKTPFKSREATSARPPPQKHNPDHATEILKPYSLIVQPYLLHPRALDLVHDPPVLVVQLQHLIPNHQQIPSLLH